MSRLFKYVIMILIVSIIIGAQPTISLSNTPGFTMAAPIGPPISQKFGTAIENLDTDGDGKIEIAVLDSSRGVEIIEYSGSAWVSIGNTWTTGVGLITNAHDITAGDYNNDGYDDLIISDYLSDSGGGGTTNEGELFIFLGSESGLGIDCNIRGNYTNGMFGYSLDSGYFDGDSYEDLLIGAPGSGLPSYGKTYVLFGKYGNTFGGGAWPNQCNAASHPDCVEFSGTAGWNNIGYVVRNVDSTNADCYDDFTVTNIDNQGISNFGVFYGKNNRNAISTVPDVYLNFMGPGNPPSWIGYGYGEDISGGDVNNDGYSDILTFGITYGLLDEGPPPIYVSPGHKVLIFPGSQTGISINNVINPNWVDFQISSTMGYYFDIEYMGDDNGDGYGDFALSCEEYITIYHGNANLNSININQHIMGTPGEHIGLSRQYGSKALCDVPDIHTTTPSKDELTVGTPNAIPNGRIDTYYGQ